MTQYRDILVNISLGYGLLETAITWNDVEFSLAIKVCDIQMRAVSYHATNLYNDFVNYTSEITDTPSKGPML